MKKGLKFGGTYQEEKEPETGYSKMCSTSDTRLKNLKKKGYRLKKASASAKRQQPAKSKKFSGKDYKLHSTKTLTELQSKKQAKELREKGYKCRRVKEGKRFLVYKCK